MELPNVDELLTQIATKLHAYIETKKISDPAMVGIHTGGAWLAEELHRQLALQNPLGTLDIAFYRDDFSENGLQPCVQPSQLPFEVDNCHILLVDDVIMSGRTIRAALNELFDYGRPASVTLVTLFELDARELPIRADVIGQSLSLAEGERIKLIGPAPFRLKLVRFVG